MYIVNIKSLDEVSKSFNITKFDSARLLDWCKKNDVQLITDELVDAFLNLKLAKRKMSLAANNSRVGAKL